MADRNHLLLLEDRDRHGAVGEGFDLAVVACQRRDVLGRCVLDAYRHDLLHPLVVNDVRARIRPTSSRMVARSSYERMTSARSRSALSGRA